MIPLLFLMFALVCFIFSAWQHQSPYWNRIVSIGLAFLVAAQLWTAGILGR